LKKIFSIALIVILFYIGTVISVISEQIPSQFNDNRLNNGTGFLTNYDDSNKVLIKLNLTGISYGQELLWKANTTGTNSEESAVTYSDGIAYIGSCSTHGAGHDKIFAVNTTTGGIIWSNVTGPGYVGPVVDGDVVYIGSCTHGNDPENEYMYAFDRFTGQQLWKTLIYGGIAESVQYDNSKIYFCSGFYETKIYALNKVDGSINWVFPTGAEVCANKPMLKDNALYGAFWYDFYEGRLFKINASTGDKIWDVALSAGPWDNSITADGQGRIFLAIYYDSTMNAYDETNGRLLWTYTLHEGSLSFNAYHNGRVFIADNLGYVYALNAVTGKRLWETKVGDCCDISSPTISGGLLFIGTHDFEEGAFFALNESTGDILWKYHVGANVYGPPSIVDGMMLCGTDNWNTYAFDFGIGEGDWLLHRYDSSNTAFSPNGLMEWQFISASCTTIDDIATCIITNTYDHEVTDIKLILPHNVSTNWYDSSGHLLLSGSNYYVIKNLSSLATLTVIISLDQVHPPAKPTMSGPSSGKVGIEYTYVVSAVDPDDSLLSYYIDWGDGSFTEWTGIISSGESLNVSHTWNEKGIYIIKAKAKNTQGIESVWSDPLPITMPYSYKPILQFLELLFQRFPNAFPLLRQLIGY
jgi:outer membrane protein assembly factor BamB